MDPEDVVADETPDFKLIKLLGHGGFARTHLAEVLDPELAREYGARLVALKIPLDRKRERAIRTDVQLNASLHTRLMGVQAENIVRYLGFGIHENMIVMVMEYVEGGNLRDRVGQITDLRPLPFADAVRITKGVARGLTFVHGESIFHRDIKPENILFQGDIPKICDFGVARVLQPHQRASTNIGTECYQAPEVLDADASFPADIWSMGVVMFEMLTGHLPFGGPFMPKGHMIDAIRAARFRAVCLMKPDVPQELGEIVAQCLSRNPEDRPTASALYDALDKFEKRDEEIIQKELAEITRISADPDCAGEVQTRLNALQKRFPKDVRIFVRRGEMLNLLRQYDAAIQAFKEGLKHHPNNALLRFNLAQAYANVGKDSSMIVAELEKALSLGLDSSLKRLAQILLSQLKGN